MFFSRISRRLTSTDNHDQTPAVDPQAIPDVEINDPNNKRKASHDESVLSQPPQKVYKRFEAASSEESCMWELPTTLAEYTNKYMHTHISEKCIRENIF